MAAARAANFDALARVYALLEHLTFGGALARRRVCFLNDPSVKNARRVLVLGDGDGRFTAALLERDPTVEVNAVDASALMLEALEQRVKQRCPLASVTVHLADARTWSPPAREFELVVAHFFFDCFTTSDVSAMVSRILPTLTPNARWLISDFAIPSGRARAFAARVLVRALYFLFWVVTGLSVKRLPDYQAALLAGGFRCVRTDTALGGVLRSELWCPRPA